MSLSKAKIAQQKAALLALKDELDAFKAATRDGAKPVDLDQPIGRLTRIDAIQMQKLTQASRRRNEVRSQQVGAALRRIEVGDYGSCNICEDDIEWARLKARPETPVCLECQQELEEG